VLAVLLVLFECTINDCVFVFHAVSIALLQATVVQYCWSFCCKVKRSCISTIKWTLKWWSM